MPMYLLVKHTGIGMHGQLSTPGHIRLDGERGESPHLWPLRTNHSTADGMPRGQPKGPTVCTLDS